MISRALKEELRPLETLPRLIWSALTASIVIYVGLAYWLAMQGRAPVELSSPELTELVFSFLAVSMGAASIFFRKMLLGESAVKRRLRKALSPEDLARNSQTGVIDKEKLKRIQMLPQNEQLLYSIAGMYFVPTLLSLTLNESIVIFGLVLSLASGSVEPIVPFAAAGILLNVSQFPSVTKFVQKASEL